MPAFAPQAVPNALSQLGDRAVRFGLGLTGGDPETMLGYGRAIQQGNIGALPGMAKENVLARVAALDQPRPISSMSPEQFNALAGGVLGTVGGVNARTADIPALLRAKELQRSGAPREQIWNDTGWFAGPDGKWRFEIDDSKAFYRGSKAAGSSYADDVFLNEPMYAAYPSLKTRRIQEFESALPAGSYDSKLGQVNIGGPDRSSTALHEMQHAIQDLEGTAAGGSVRQFYPPPRGQAPEDAALLHAEARKQYEDLVNQSRLAGVTPPGYYDAPMETRATMLQRAAEDLYYRLAGEAESRAVQARMSLKPDERKARPFWLDYDVPEAEQLVRR